MITDAISPQAVLDGMREGGGGASSTSCPFVQVRTSTKERRAWDSGHSAHLFNVGTLGLHDPHLRALGDVLAGEEASATDGAWLDLECKEERHGDERGW